MKRHLNRLIVIVVLVIASAPAFARVAPTARLAGGVVIAPSSTSDAKFEFTFSHAWTWTADGGETTVCTQRGRCVVRVLGTSEDGKLLYSIVFPEVELTEVVGNDTRRARVSDDGAEDAGADALLLELAGLVHDSVIRVDLSPSGQVTLLTGTEQIRADAALPENRRRLGIVHADAMPMFVQRLVHFDPQGTIREPGASWAHEPTQISCGPVRAEAMVNWTLSSLKENEASLTGSTAIHVLPAKMDAKAATIRLGSFTASSKARWDVQAGHLLQLTDTRAVELTAALGGIEHAVGRVQSELLVSLVGD